MPIYICAILLMIAADQAVKYWAFTSLQAQQTIPLINGVFHLTYIENRGENGNCNRNGQYNKNPA